MSRPRPGDAPTAVGEAEEQAFGGTDAEALWAFEDLARLAHDVTTSEWWHAADGPAVTLRRGRSSARSSRARSVADRSVDVSLAAGQHDLATLAHELAHALAGVECGHDARYRAAVVDVAAIVVGLDAGIALAAAFESFGLDRARRPWPPPWRAAGRRFQMGPAIANVGTNHLNGGHPCITE